MFLKIHFSLAVAVLFFISDIFSQENNPKTALPPQANSFTTVDKAAEFPGGVEGWTKYLIENLKYPKKAIKQNIQGMVKVQFRVDSTGKVSEITALNNPGGGLAEEAVRIIANGPNWIPAEQNGRKVIFRQIQAIYFKLE
jgi:protein TonB